jgi:hypothetical protein
VVSKLLDQRYMRGLEIFCKFCSKKIIPKT